MDQLNMKSHPRKHIEPRIMDDSIRLVYISSANNMMQSYQVDLPGNTKTPISPKLLNIFQKGDQIWNQRDFLHQIDLVLKFFDQVQKNHKIVK